MANQPARRVSVPNELTSDLAHVVRLRWQFDRAREPNVYPAVKLGAVARETDDVLVLYDFYGNPINRYRIRNYVHRGHPDQQAYAVLVEL